MTIKFSIRNLLSIAFIIFLFYVGYKSRQVLVAASMGALLAYMINPVVEKLCRHKIPRLISTVLVVCTLIIIVSVAFLWLAPKVYKDIEDLAKNMPVYIKHLIDSLGKLEKIFKIDLSASAITEQAMKWVQEYSKTIGNWLKGIAGSIPYVFEVTINIIMVPMIAFILLVDYPKMTGFIDTYIGKQTDSRRYLNLFSEVMASYFRGQIVVALILGVLYTVVLVIVGLDAAILLGVMTGLLSIVPFLGFTIGIFASVIAAAIQFQDFIHPVYVILGYGVVQLLESFVITPNIVGSSVGVHPVMTIILLLVGGNTFGLMGMVLVLPIASFLFQIYKTRYSHHINSELHPAGGYSGKGGTGSQAPPGNMGGKSAFITDNGGAAGKGILSEDELRELGAIMEEEHTDDKK